MGNMVKWKPKIILFSKVSIDNKSALVQVMVWQLIIKKAIIWTSDLIGNKSLAKPSTGEFIKSLVSEEMKKTFFHHDFACQ